MIVYAISFKNDFATLSIGQSKGEMLPFRPWFFQYLSWGKFYTWEFLNNPYDCTGCKHESEVLWFHPVSIRTRDKNYGRTYYLDKVAVHH